MQNAGASTSVGRFDVIVVGGGHAGVEAAVGASRAGARRIGLVTSDVTMIGQMSCNPAVGGIAKGTVAREVDALGGVMGRATDRSMIQFRMLNRGKGPAVWAPRAQCDRALYRRAVQNVLAHHPTVAIIQGTVGALVMAPRGVVSGVRLLDGSVLRARAVVIATGTFLRGRIFIGTTTSLPAGRAGEPAATELALQLASLGFETGRFKTGTPPRIDGRTVDFTRLQRQQSELDQFRYRWSRLELAVTPLPQTSCWLTWAGNEVKELVAAHLNQSAMYGGAIAAMGPRYCPSIEDKVVRFPAAERHQVFLEPEGLDTRELYVNGLSTSLPAEVQQRMLRAVPGLERVDMTRPGYAIEYDYYPPTALYPWLESRHVPGLFFAGQVNGTTGYEEAAAQGVVAGINAGRKAADLPPVTFGRESSYIGVLVDDLVNRGVDEPYRLFTSRSEFRLTVRQDNAVSRLAPLGKTLGLYSTSEAAALDARLNTEQSVSRSAREQSAAPALVNGLLQQLDSTPIQQPQRIGDLVRRSGLSLGALFAACGLAQPDDPEALTTVELELKYAGYFARERLAAGRLRALAEFPLPGDAPYDTMRSLSTEARQKLQARRPVTLAQAATIPGVSPADLQNLVLELERRRALGQQAAG